MTENTKNIYNILWDKIIFWYIYYLIADRYAGIDNDHRHKLLRRGNAFIHVNISLIFS